MKINEVKDKVTDYDVDDTIPSLDALWHEQKSNRYNADISVCTDYDVDDPNPLLDALRDDQESNQEFNSDNSDDDMSINISITKVSNLRKARKRGEKSVTKQIPAEFITFAAKLFNELKNRLIDITETTSAQSDLVVLQSSRSNSKPTLKLSKSEQAELRKIGHIYNNIFRDSSDMKVASVFIADDVARSSEEDVSTSFSLLHTRAEGKINRLNFATSTTNWNVLKASNAENYAKEKQKSIINPEGSISGTKMDGNMEGKNMMGHIESTDDESMFYITKKSEEGTLTDREMHYYKTKRPQTKKIVCKQLKILQLDKELETVKELQKKVVKIGTSVSQNYTNRFFEKVVRSDLNDVIERDNKSAGDNLDILSNLTDNKCSNVVKVKDDDVTEHKRLSFTKNRQSIALGRKELLSNIEKAQAALQTSKLALDDSNSFKVDKTTQFDNESISEESIKEHSPLKKTAFGETSYMREPKEATVPIYSTQGTNAQINLVNTKPVSKPDLDKSNYLTSTAVPKTLKFGSLRSLAKCSENMTEFCDTESKPMRLHTHEHEPPMSQVLVFDQLNPLNNILLHPNNFTEVHKYNPLKAEEKLRNSESSQHFDKHYNQAYRVGIARDFEVRTMTVQQHRFVPRSAQEAHQEIKYSTSYSVDAAKTDSTKLSEDSLHDKFSSNKSSMLTKTKKQISTPSIDKHKHHGSVGVTPKVQKKFSFKRKKELTSIDKTMNSPAPAKHEKKNSNQTSKIRDKKLPKTKMTKPGQNITVRQLIADYIGFDTSIEHNNDLKEKCLGGNINVNTNSQNVTAYSQSNVSFSSSKNLNPMKNFLSPPYEECLSLHQPTMQSMPFQEDREVKPPSSKVLVFDYLNSLNNVLISPFNFTKAHKYNPMKSEKTFYCSKHSRSNKEYYNHTTADFNMQTETCKQHLAVPQVSITQEENQGIRFSKLYSADKEKQATDINNTINKISDISLHDHFRSNTYRNVTKNKKRSFSPSKGRHRHLNFVQVTPKPITKKQKISTNPKVSTKVKIKVHVKLPSTDESPHSLEPQKEDNCSIEKSTHTLEARDDKSAKTNVTKPERSVTVKQLIAEYTGFDIDFKHDDNNKNLSNNGNSNLNLKSKSFTEFSQSDATFTFSKNLRPMKDIVSTINPECQTSHHSIVPVVPYQVGWPPELMPLKNNSDSSANVVSMIDMLPFMGSHECEWETSLADTWSFRLLHGQLRLMARLAHRLDNAARTLVRGDTPVLDINVKIVRQDEKDLVARMCLRFVCETMRHLVSRALRSKCIASDIPPLLHRCTAVVRVALRWKRAMHDAKQRLAYTLDSSGNLSLKVANIPLRSVWEVTMRIGLVLDNYNSVPCPRATNVRVLPVVSDVLVPTVYVRRALRRTPKDWGNVPVTIWRMYRLLKHKKRDDNLLR